MAQCGKREEAAWIVRECRDDPPNLRGLAWAANVILDDLEALEKERQAELDAVLEGPETEPG